MFYCLKNNIGSTLPVKKPVYLIAIAALCMYSFYGPSIFAAGIFLTAIIVTYEFGVYDMDRSPTSPLSWNRVPFSSNI